MTTKYISGPITKADAGGLEAVISTPTVDHDGESVDPLGLRNRDEYLANPLVYWAHEWARNPAAEPIGKATRLDVSWDRIDSAAVYAPTQKAQNVRALVQGGFVRKTSIGFDPITMVEVRGVPTHTAWNLLEWSIVPMPANSEATITGVKSALRWLADEVVEPVEEASVVTVKLDATALIDALDDAALRLTPGSGEVSVVEDNRRIAVIRRPRVLRAAWSSAYINALPDSAFACIDSAGRHYPHHNAEGALDLPHLRAALSRIGDPSNAQCGARHLQAHARAAGMGD